MKKADLRQMALRDRAEISPMDAVAASGRIADKFFESVDLSDVTVLHSYMRIGRFNEIDTSMILYRLRRDHPHISTVAPRSHFPTRTIESVVFSEASEFVTTKWGIREPSAGEPIDPARIDLVIVPLLCFDEGGHRVGYGKGMYDRFLARCRPDCQKVGLSYFAPVPVIEDADEHDVLLDLCITPDCAYSFKNEQLRIEDCD